MRGIIIALVLSSIIGLIKAQETVSEDSTVLNMEEWNLKMKVKQLDEFISRFNGEFPELKERKLNRNQKLFLLIDYDYYQSDTNLVKGFIRSIDSNNYSINYLKPSWYAEVVCLVKFNGKKEEVTLQMQVEADAQGKSRWVIKRAFLPFIEVKAKKSNRSFINPVNNETNFSDLSTYIKRGNIQNVLREGFEMNHLSVFMYLVQTKEIVFDQVQSVKYVFYTPKYRFEVQNFNRANYNSGWLISKIIHDTSAKPILDSKDLIEHEVLKRNEAIDAIIIEANKHKSQYNE